MSKSRKLLRAIRLLRSRKSGDCEADMMTFACEEDDPLKNRINQWLRESCRPDFEDLSISPAEEGLSSHRKNHGYAASNTSFDSERSVEVLYHPDFADWGSFENTQAQKNERHEMDLRGLLDEAHTTFAQLFGAHQHQHR
jgi:hypothetical protein